MEETKSIYRQIIAAIFKKYYKEGTKVIPFARPEIIEAANQLGLPVPKNPGDVVYSFRYRRNFPELITETEPEGYEWIIRGAGISQYRFALVNKNPFVPCHLVGEIRVPDATPGVITLYALNDEQALLAKLRHNHLIDIFTGFHCYSLQSHLRTTVPDMGQVETDEIYIGVDKHGAHYVLPVQAKVGKDKLGIVQIEQDFALCANKFPQLICRSIAALFMPDGLIALFQLKETSQGTQKVDEKHYRLVRPEELTPGELLKYRNDSLANG